MGQDGIAIGCEDEGYLDCGWTCPYPEGCAAGELPPEKWYIERCLVPTEGATWGSLKAQFQ